MAWIKVKTTTTGEKRYKVQYHAPDGRSHSKTFARSEDARQFKRDIENASRQGTYLDPKLARVRLEEYWPTYLASSPHLRPTTRELYSSLARIHMLPVLGSYRLASLTVADVNRFIAELETRGVRPPTINAAFRLLSAVLSSAEHEGIVVNNPARRSGARGRIKLPTVARDEMRFLEPGEVYRLADAVPPRYRALVLLLGFCGPRVGEALALRVADLDLLRRRMSITRTLTELHNGTLLFGEPKTRASRRALALPSFICDELAAHLTRFGAGGDGLVFTSSRGGPVRLRYFRSHDWRPAVARVGMEPLRIHDLRHTAVAIATKAGAHPKQIQAMCGHGSITITLDRYGHMFDSLAEGLAQLVDTIGREAAADAGAVSVPRAGGSSDQGSTVTSIGPADQRRRRDSNPGGTFQPLTA